MATRAVGLDIGTFAVRAAEVEMGRDGPAVTRFGQLSLPHGAVVAGEVVDHAAVGAAIRSLWEQVGFSSRDVSVGVGNQRVIVRQAELPAMAPQDMEAALQFEASELIPFPVEDARLDFQVLDEVVGADGQPRAHILLAAAQRRMLDGHLRAVEAAGLNAVRMDPLPLALVRALLRPTVIGEPDPIEAIVCVGAGVTTIAVHEAGVPRFARFLPNGAGAATEDVSRELEIDIDAAEDLKRRAGSEGSDPRVEAVVERVVRRLVADIVGSIGFYASQSPAEVTRILLTGSGSLLPGLRSHLASELHIAVEVPDLSDYRLALGLSALDAERALVNLPGAIGLALGATPAMRGERRINLIPAHVVAGRTQRRETIIAGTLVALTAAGLVTVWAGKASEVTKARNDAQTAQARAAALQQKVTQLQSADTLPNEVQAGEGAVHAALAGDVAWSSLLQQIATVIPNDVWLTSLQVQAGTATTPGTITFAGAGFDHTSTARWLLRMGDLKTLTNLWVANSTANPQSGATFSSTATLTPATQANRVNQFIVGAQ
jgi:type IV pilus assembly protein PilM